MNSRKEQYTGPNQNTDQNPKLLQAINQNIHLAIEWEIPIV